MSFSTEQHGALNTLAFRKYLSLSMKRIACKCVGLSVNDEAFWTFFHFEK